MRSRYMLIAVLLIAVVVFAGNQNPTNPPSATYSYTLEDIYNRLKDGTEGDTTTFTEPAVGPGTGTMHTLNEIMAKAPAKDDANGATTGNVLTGKTFWGLTGGQWGTKTGTMPVGSNVLGPGGSKTFSIPDGFYSGKTATANDADLVAGNIKDGVNIFGVEGTLVEIQAASRVPKTGQNTSYRTGDDGDYELGVLPEVEPTAGTHGVYTVYGWKGTRFTDNGDGTVTDNLTGLMWTQDAYIWGPLDWNSAIDSCNAYSLAGYDDWRLPNINELHSLIDPTQSPALPDGHPFTDVRPRFVWSSTTDEVEPTDADAWGVALGSGLVLDVRKDESYCAVWPVRGGQ